MCCCRLGCYLCDAKFEAKIITATGVIIGNIIIKMHDKQLGRAWHRDHCVFGNLARCDLETAATHAALIPHRGVFSDANRAKRSIVRCDRCKAAFRHWGWIKSGIRAFARTPAVPKGSHAGVVRRWKSQVSNAFPKAGTQASLSIFAVRVTMKCV
jgi:hypothetical protein